jgi:hypothetical protein
VAKARTGSSQSGARLVARNPYTIAERLPNLLRDITSDNGAIAA